MSEWALQGVPVYTLAEYKGMGRAPAALRKAGIGRSLGTETDLGDVSISPLRRDKPDGAVKNLAYFREATSRIYAATKAITSDRVLLVGGECSETVGSMAGLAGAFGGKPGMLWLDAHGDFNTPETSPSGYIGGMCLAMGCAKGPDLAAELGGKRPPLAEERLVHMGSRALDPAEVAAFNSSPAKLFTAQQVKKSGAADVGEEAARHLDNRSDWVACHLDVDVVDPTVIQAVNYPTPGGLTPDEVAMIVRALLKSGKMRALEVCAYNSAKDRRGASAEQVVKLLTNVFR